LLCLLQAIEALTTCHAAHPYAKFWGACNDHKWALDRCLRQEKVINRKVNLEKARTEQARLRSRLDAARARQEAAN
jgi:hypothetical protein